MAYYDHGEANRKKACAEKFEELKKSISSLDKDNKLSEWHLAYQHIVDMENNIKEYKDKIKGRFVTIFTVNGAKLKKGYIHFPKKSGLDPIKTNVQSLKQVRIIPQSSCYVIEVVYEKQEKEKMNNDNYLSNVIYILFLCSFVNFPSISLQSYLISQGFLLLIPLIYFFKNKKIS